MVQIQDTSVLPDYTLGSHMKHVLGHSPNTTPLLYTSLQHLILDVIVGGS